MSTNNSRVLGIDVGGTKTAWGLYSEREGLLGTQRAETPAGQEGFIALLEKIVSTHSMDAIGVSIAGTVSADHEDVIVCTNLPALSHTQLARRLREVSGVPVTLDNDARCALIGEVACGAAKDFSSAVMLTLGTGVGGAVMQRKIVLQHPQDVSKEIGRIVVDPSDALATPAGRGTVEALLGGRNLEARFGFKMADLAARVRTGDPEAKQIWEHISYYFLQSVRTIHAEFSCKNIVIGGIGSKDLEFYIGGNQMPCPVIAGKLGGEAGIYGAAAIALDLHKDEESEEWE